jgi:hypothetical protein
VAYRQLFAAVLATTTSLLAVACGGDSSASVPDPGSGDQQPPRNPDAPPYSDDQPPTPADPPPLNPDGFGQLGSLCRTLCQKTEGLQCGDDGILGELNAACEQGCKVSVDFLPCAGQLVQLFQCLTTQSGLCQGENAGVGDCEASEDAYIRCLGVDQGGPSNPPPGNDCTPGGGCDCDSACLACRCVNPGPDMMECAAVCMP